MPLNPHPLFRQVCEELKDRLRKFGSTLLIDEDRVRKMLGWETVDNLHR